jgi:hypothetical protein
LGGSNRQIHQKQRPGGCGLAETDLLWPLFRAGTFFISISFSYFSGLKALLYQKKAGLQMEKAVKNGKSAGSTGRKRGLADTR